MFSSVKLNHLVLNGLQKSGFNHIQNHNQSEDDIIALAFNGLFKLDNEGKPIVDLAKNWEIT